MTYLADRWGEMLSHLGYSLVDPHFTDSPQRVARFMYEWHTQDKAPPKLTTFPNDAYDALVAVGGIRFYSLCAHHGLPFYGTAAVGYIPGKRIVGLSKLARVVDHFARRFQTQELLTHNVANYLRDQLAPQGIGVVMRAEHLCMSMRGIQRPGHTTVTSAMFGSFRTEPEARHELLALIKERE